MSKKPLSIIGVATPIILHTVVMSAILVLVLLNIKYGIESELMSSNHFYLVDSVYGVIYLLYFGSIISFIVLHLAFCFISKWIENKKKTQAAHIEKNQ